MKFKAEVALLVVAITLFITAVVFYSYQNAGTQDAVTLAQNSAAAFPYRNVALLFVGVGSLSMVTASVSYSKKTKELIK